MRSSLPKLQSAKVCPAFGAWLDCTAEAFNASTANNEWSSESATWGYIHAIDLVYAYTSAVFWECGCLQSVGATVLKYEHEDGCSDEQIMEVKPIE
jgi:hypothetical protein